MGAARRTWRQRFADWWESRDGLAADQVSMARAVRASADRIAALEARAAERDALIAELQAWKATHQEHADAWTEGLARAFTVAGQPVPAAVTADMPTTPLLRIVS